MGYVVTQPAHWFDRIFFLIKRSGFKSHRKGIEENIEMDMVGIFSISLTKDPIKALLCAVGLAKGK